MPDKNNRGFKKPNKTKENKDLKLNRRDFLKLSVPVTGLFVFGLEPIFGQASNETPTVVSPDTVAMLYESSKCLGCRRCEDACRRWNKLGDEYRPTDVSPKSLTTLKYREVNEKGKTKWLPSKWQCMHCLDPSCVNVCPTEALQKTKEGPVSYDESNCIGCQYCVSACPFSIPRFDWEHNRVVKKCTFCTDRLAEGLEPACSSVCPVNALTFGDRKTVIGKAAEAQFNGAYIYGKDEAGGTSWIYTSDVSFEERGVPSVKEESYPLYSKTMLGSQLGTIAFGLTALGVYSVYLRRKRLNGG
ncbi:MAG: 4Fe-4S dicluster domain-containing protein [Dehalococcoidia bacterium]|nr:MAG: 4Fe-4S dicluster domain-containing protein [Dehalococcoidia bacterium]